jgi:phage gp46-like protein
VNDIATVWNGAGGDWLVAGAALATQPDLETALNLSLFTDRVLPDGSTPTDGSGDPRGWWGDDDQYPIGSRLWTLERAKQTTQTLVDAKAFIVEALQWLIDDGVVASFDITTEWDGQGFLAAQVVAVKPNGTAQAFAYAWAWNGIS